MLVTDRYLEIDGVHLHLPDLSASPRHRIALDRFASWLENKFGPLSKMSQTLFTDEERKADERAMLERIASYPIEPSQAAAGLAERWLSRMPKVEHWILGGRLEVIAELPKAEFHQPRAFLLVDHASKRAIELTVQISRPQTLVNGPFKVAFKNNAVTALHEDQELISVNAYKSIIPE